VSVGWVWATRPSGCPCDQSVNRWRRLLRIVCRHSKHGKFQSRLTPTPNSFFAMLSIYVNIFCPKFSGSSGKWIEGAKENDIAGSMGDEDGYYYENLSDYENDLYDLNHEADRAEDESESAPDEEDCEGEHTSGDESTDPASRSRAVSGNASLPPVAPSPPSLDTNGILNGYEEDEEDSTISDDERDLIYSSLYHSNTTHLTTTPSKKTAQPTSDSPQKPKGKGKRSKSPDQPSGLASTKFTFELDLDNIPSPSIAVEQQPRQVINIDSDSDDDNFHTRGRYFAPQDHIRTPAQQPLCYRCNQRGHIVKDCPHTLCRICGAIDAHHERLCPSRHTCTNCGQRGHQTRDCPIRHNEDPSKPCSMCRGWGHVSAICHQIWRLYRPADPTRTKHSDFARWCYNCGVEGHLGDECKRPRPLHVQGGRVGPIVSAFGQANVPEWVKLSSQRPDQSKKRKNKVDEEDDEDDWFHNREKQKDKPNSVPPRKVGSINIKPSTVASKPKSRREPAENAAEARRSSSEHMKFTMKVGVRRNLQDRITTPPPAGRPRSNDRNSVDSYRPAKDSYRPQGNSYRPQGDSYVPRHGDRDREAFHRRDADLRDWGAEMDHWKRNRDSDSRW
jgi:hypothetical protein